MKQKSTAIAVCFLMTMGFGVLDAFAGKEAKRLRRAMEWPRADTTAYSRVFVEDWGAGAALIKGGHRSGRPDDLLAVRKGAGAADVDAPVEIVFEWLEGERIEAGPVHGTGCALSAAITARIARGDDVETAVRAGRTFVRDAIANAFPLRASGAGARVLGFGGSNEPHEPTG